ncbi:hypothetical protein AB0E06_37655 [Streptomyces sp. NPDC048109]|uniref:hypothetical protein n=1 Tax=Streptomyces TaxID=1883 RepID=UPI0033FC823E
MPLAPHQGRRGLLTAAATGLATAGATLLVVAFLPATARTPTSPPLPAVASSSAPAVPIAPTDVPVLSPSRPDRVTAASVGLDAGVSPVATAADGTIALPGQGERAG